MMRNDNEAVWSRAVRLVEGVTALLTLAVLLGTPLLVLHDQVTRLNHIVSTQGTILEAMVRANERQDETIQQLLERLARLEGKVTEIRDRTRELDSGAWKGPETQPLGLWLQMERQRVRSGNVW